MNRYFFTLFQLTKLMVRRYLRNRLALFFTIIFPLIFLFIFGFLYGNNSSPTFNVTVINQSSSTFATSFTKQIKDIKAFKIKDASTLDSAKDTLHESNLDAAKSALNKSNLDAIIVLPPTFGQNNAQQLPGGQAEVLYSPNNTQAGQTVAQILDSAFAGVNAQITNTLPPLTVTTTSTGKPGLTAFDYVFSGLLGFSLIGLGIFGPVNMLPGEKKTGALTRLRVTPLHPSQFIIAYMISSLLSGLLSVFVQYVVAVNVFHFHAVGSLWQFALFFLLGAILIFGIGVGVGGWARDEKQAAPLSNLVAFPLMFLTGTFFPRFLMPEWLQQITAYLPLTPVIDGIRMILTEGKTFLDLGPQFAVIGIWLVVIYGVAFRVFRWD